ncbi:MAG: GNAT family N-acetyltransferase [Anaerolineaceae bacterium]|nr:GNAT family N-acetyltransferase [Anaerolineaceae bacterium]
MRPIDIRKDLSAIADLIELCFRDHLDADGQIYLEQMRRAADNAHYFTWAMNRKLQMPVSGYVWEDCGQITGNVSLMPVNKDGSRVFMIANVAVHPDYRHLGIGRALTEKALAYSQQQGSQSAWLQVRDDNLEATHIYSSLGFVERTRRSTWIVDPAGYSPPTLNTSGFRIGRRRKSDWPQHTSWLDVIYPSDIRWNLPMNQKLFKPGFKQAVWRFLNDFNIHHWVARLEQHPVGVVSWTSSHLAEDYLWLATAPENEPQVITYLLPQVIKSRITRRPMSLNYPAGKADVAFIKAGFVKQNTLIWMEKKLPP